MMTMSSPEQAAPATPPRNQTILDLLRIPSGSNPISARLALLMGIMANVGIVLLAVYAWQEGEPQVFAVGALVALATSAIASVGGFLFGLPRYNPEFAAPTHGASSRAQSTVRTGQGSTTSAYTPSNNLEQVSDWLTKLLLGAGLVQLGHMGRWLGNFIEGLAAALIGSNTEVAPPAAKVFAGSLIGFYTAFGFLFGYVLTTTWYREVLQGTSPSPKPSAPGT